MALGDETGAIIYRKLYTKLFTSITDALEELERLNVGQARETLCRAQQEAEELYLDSGE